jgi:hypothetical protein
MCFLVHKPCYTASWSLASSANEEVKAFPAKSGRQTLRPVIETRIRTTGQPLTRFQRNVLDYANLRAIYIHNLHGPIVFDAKARESPHEIVYIHNERENVSTFPQQIWPTRASAFRLFSLMFTSMACRIFQCGQLQGSGMNHHKSREVTACCQLEG